MRLTSLNTGPVIQVIGRTAGATLARFLRIPGRSMPTMGSASKRSRAAVKTLVRRGIRLLATVRRFLILRSWSAW